MLLRFINRLSQRWKDNGFEILVMLSLGVIFILALFRIGKKGTYSKSYHYTGNNAPHNSGGDKRTRGPPKDSKGEIECRRVLEKLFNRPFNKARPDFLRNPVTGGINNLELDCFCPELKLAVEYSGQQHYKYVPFFHANKEAFLNQKYRDDMKKRMCKENGITLIEVPYTVKNEKIEEFLIRELLKTGYLK